MEGTNSINDMKLLMDDMNVSFFIVDKEDFIIDANPRGLRLMGNLNLESGCPVRDLFAPAKSRENILSFLEHGVQDNLTREEKLADGSVKKAAYRLSEDGTSIYLTIYDLFGNEQSESLLKQSERLKRVLLDNLNSSFMIIDKRGLVERSHFVGDLAVLMGTRSFLTRLDKIFNRDIATQLLTKAANMKEMESRSMSHYRFDLNNQILWLDIFISLIEGEKFFLSIDDKTSEHFLLERMDKLAEVEMSCRKVNEISGKAANLISGVAGYVEMAMKKSDNQIVLDILDSIRKVTADGLNLINVISSNTNMILTPQFSESKDGSEISSDDSSSFEYVFMEKAIVLLENNRELYQTVVEDFLKDYSDVLERLSRFFESDREGAQILVHSIKGVAGILGAYSLQEEANLLEGYMRRNNWDEAEKARRSFSEQLNGVLGELEQISRGNEKIDDREKWNLHGKLINSHQKDLLREIIPLAEAGDYNGLKEYLKQYAVFDWEDDWSEIIRILSSHVDEIDFDATLETINTLID